MDETHAPPTVSWMTLVFLTAAAYDDELSPAAWRLPSSGGPPLPSSRTLLERESP